MLLNFLAFSCSLVASSFYGAVLRPNPGIFKGGDLNPGTDICVSPGMTVR